MNLIVLKLTSYTFGIINEEKVASKSKHKTKKFEKIKRKAQMEQRKCQKKAFHATQPNPPFPQRSMMSAAHTPTLPIGHAAALLSQSFFLYLQSHANLTNHSPIFPSCHLLNSSNQLRLTASISKYLVSIPKNTPAKHTCHTVSMH